MELEEKENERINVLPTGEALILPAILFPSRALNTFVNGLGLLLGHCFDRISHVRSSNAMWCLVRTDRQG